jgi:hypothetical protein
MVKASLRVALAGLCAAVGIYRPDLASAAEPQNTTRKAEVLYNGIVLPSPWPPRPAQVPRDPITPAYLVAPPAVIPIDVGRQLFVDDFLVADTTMKRSFHKPVPHPDNPILKPEKLWEGADKGGMAMPFSDGVWWDPKDQTFKMWYLGSKQYCTCLALSKDGVHWTRPALDVVPGTNIVYDRSKRDAATVILDLEEKDPAKRYKMFRSAPSGSTLEGERPGGGKHFGQALYFSSDGIHWNEPPVLSGGTGDRCSVFWNPFRKVWVYSLRGGWDTPRVRRYWETPDLVSGPKWLKTEDPPLWTGADSKDPMRSDIQFRPELYNLDCVAYESLTLGLFSILRKNPAKVDGKSRDKINDIFSGFSRDGWSWSRPDREPFVAVSEDPNAWNWGNVQSAGGCCLVVGDKLWFYYSGRKEGVCSAGLALLRRDGFASMDAGDKEATLTTRNVSFKGKHLFVNVDDPTGELRVEVLDVDGNVIPPFTRANCGPVTADTTLAAVGWTGAPDLSALAASTAQAGKPFKFRFYLKGGSLYSFWVSPDKSGASYGYVAAGGPGFINNMGTVGIAAYPAVQ